LLKIGKSIATFSLIVARWISKKVNVLYKRQVMEEGYSENVFSPPFHPYSENLLDSIPEPYPDSKFLESRKEDGILDEADNENPNGCPFVIRCNYALDVCNSQRPPCLAFANNHHVYWQRPPEKMPLRASHGAGKSR
jgi:peptide/nickel transport system ATP-binding protein